MSSVRYDQLNRLARAEYYDNMDVSDNEWETTGSMLAAYRNTFTYDANGNILSQNRHGHATTVNMDSMTYHYQSGTNKLTYVDDVVSSGNYDDDIDDQSSGNYTYNEIGNMISDAAEQIAAIEWTVYGKIKSINRTGGSSKSNLAFEYSPDGHRVMKRETPNGGSGTPSTTWYTRDAQGNNMAIYEERNDSIWLEEQEIYGSSRVGMVKKDVLLNSLSLDTVSYQIKRGEKRYELSNHLGNVLAVISDKLNRVCNNDTVSYFNAEVLFAYDYSPFGAILPQRSYAADSSCTTVIDYDTTYNDHYEVTFTLTTLLSPGQNIRLDNGNGTTKILATYNAGYVNVLSYKGQIITNVSPAADGIIYITQSGATLKLRFSADSLGFICGDNVSVISGTTTLTSVSIDCAIDSIYSVDTITICNNSDYRFGFNGKERDNEGMGGGGATYDYGFRIYNPNLGRFLSVDPLFQSYPYYTPYQFAGNMPIIAIDLDGLEEFLVIVKPHPTDAALTVTDVFKIDPQSRKSVEGFGTGGVEYRVTDANGNTTTNRQADVKQNTIEEFYLNGEVNAYSKADNSDEPVKSKRRDIMMLRQLDENGNILTNNNIQTGETDNKYIRPNIILSGAHLVSVQLEVYFNTDKTAISRIDVVNYDIAIKKLDKVVSVMNEYPGIFKNKDIVVQGSFDIRTSNYKGGCGNPCLSEDRAKNVANYLKSKLNDKNVEINSSGATTNNSTTVNASDRNAHLFVIPK